MKYAKIKKCDIANGEGVRVSLFVSGCEHYCKGCFNKEAWDFKYGEEYTPATQEKIISYLAPEHITGFTLLGGEPMHPVNRAAILSLVKKIKATYPKKNIWCYSGYTLDELLNENDSTLNELLEYIDILVDGRFIDELKSPNLRFKGSSNQRIIKLKNTLQSGIIELWDGDKKQEMSNASKDN